jgi:hypothetical protein
MRTKNMKIPNFLFKNRRDKFLFFAALKQVKRRGWACRHDLSYMNSLCQVGDIARGEKSFENLKNEILRKIEFYSEVEGIIKRENLLLQELAFRRLVRSILLTFYKKIKI